MKYFILLFSVLALISCKEEALKDYVSLSGHIDNLEENDTILLVSSKAYIKKIAIDATGNFKDTLHISGPDFYSLSLSSKARFPAYFNMGDELEIHTDKKDINNTLTFKGRGEESNNYITTRTKEVTIFSEKVKSLFALDSIEFNKEMSQFEDKFNKLLSNKAIDTAVVSREKIGLAGYVKNIKSKYSQEHAILVGFAKGKVSPKFVDFENYNGGTTSLDDLKGSYVYIDVWATWCRPCLSQIPALKQLEKDYEGKNIKFVSISTDKPEKHEAWKNMIKAKGMSGVQLYAGADQSFMRDYQINTIPRFIFIDTEGNIIDANAPRPSQTETIKALFSEQGL